MSRELMQQALEALQAYGAHTPNCDYLMLLTSLPPQRKPCSCGLVAAITALRERLAQTVTDYWQEEARRYAQNADYWRSEAEKAQHIIDCPRCGHCCPQQPVQEPVKFKCTVIDDANPNGVPLSQWECQSEQEPFCYHDGRNIVGKEYLDHSDVFPLYTAPQPRQWQGLTDEEVKTIFNFVPTASCQSYEHWRSLVAHAIEAKLKEKNHG